MNGRHLVILNQEANYLTTGLANAFREEFDSVTLVVGMLYPQGEPLDPRVQVVHINRMHERPSWKKAWSYLVGLGRMWWLLMTRFRQHEVLFVSVPPMGYLLNLVVPHRFSMVIWDLYPDTFKVTGMSERHWMYRIWSWLNRRSFRKAYRIFTIGDVLADAIGEYAQRSKLIVQPIWSMYREVPRILRDQNVFSERHELQGRFVVQYSGNIGLTHNVESLIEIAELMIDYPLITFQIIGRGGRIPVIAKTVRDKSLTNVHLLPFQSEEMFPYSISAADLGVVILDERVGHGSVPSKAYNLMSFGIPALYLSSPGSQLALDAERFGHAVCFSANQHSEIVQFILRLAADPMKRNEMSLAALSAAKNFTPNNATRFVQSYSEGFNLSEAELCLKHEKS